jgi:hypothetical protein
VNNDRSALRFTFVANRRSSPTTRKKDKDAALRAL